MKTNKQIFKDLAPSLFANELVKRVNLYFIQNGINKTANGLMVLKIMFYLIWVIVSYYCLFLENLNLLQAYIAWIFYGIGIGLLIVNISHDASHGALSSKTQINKLLSNTWNLVGISRFLWEWKHNHNHHPFTNIPGLDPDISQSNLIKVHSFAKRKKRHQFQYLYAVFLYSFYTLFLVLIKDFMILNEYKNQYKDITHTPMFRGLKMLMMKAFYLTYSLIIPIIFMPFPWWTVLTMFIVSHLCVGLLLALFFVPAHVNNKATFVLLNKDGNINNNWMKHEIESTIDISPESKLLNWLSGGLNTHVAHHLFPGICHIHYRNITPIIKEVCLEFGVQYKASSITEGLVDHFTYLKKTGHQINLEETVF
jgi:linoleoyl-CoA desaturase